FRSTMGAELRCGGETLSSFPWIPNNPFANLVFDRVHHKAPELDGTVVPLEHEGSRFPFLAVQCPSGDSRDCRIRNHRPAVEHHGDPSAQKGYVIGLPLPGILGRIFIGFQKTVDSANIDIHGVPALVVLDLDLVAAPKIYPAIAPLGVSELHVKLEVPELLIADQIGTGLGTDQDSVTDLPLFFFPIHMPPTEVPSVEEFNGPVPFWVFHMGQFGR